MTDQLISTTTPAEPTPMVVDATKGASLYMLLWAPLPEPDPDVDAGPLKYRELGWVQAHDPDRAKQAGLAFVRLVVAPEGDDAESWKPHDQRERVNEALAKHGLKLRPIARRGWPEEDDVKPTRLINRPELEIG